MGPQNEADSIPAIHAALDHGIHWIDTAALYGLGHSEQVVARAIRDRKAASLCVHQVRAGLDERSNHRCTPERKSIQRKCEDSLRRLRTDVIDLYQVHCPEADDDIEEGWRELARLKREGKVGYIGVFNFSVSKMERAQAIAPITALQPVAPWSSRLDLFGESG